MAYLRSAARQALREAGESETCELVTQFLGLRDPLLYSRQSQWPPRTRAETQDTRTTLCSEQSAALTLEGL